MLRLLLLTSCFISSSYLFAQTSKLDSIQFLDEVSVTAQTYKEVIPAQVLGARQLEVLSSFSVADAIRYFSGVQIKDYGGIGGLKTVDIRSMGTHHMGVFYDGIQLGNAQNGQIDLGKFSLDNIDEISLYNGQKSEIFQSAKEFGAAGSIYLRPRQPKFKENNNNFNFYLRSGSFDLINPSFLWEHKLSRDVSFSLNTEYIYSSGKYKFRYRKVFEDGTVAWDTTAVRQNGDIHSVRIESALYGIINDGTWNFRAYYYDSERGIPGAIVNNVWEHSQRQWDKNFFAQGNFKKNFSNKYEMHIRAKYANDWMRYLNPDTTLMYLNNRFRQHELYLSAANKYSIYPNWDVNLSVDYVRNSLDSNLKQFAYPRRSTVLVALATAFEWKRLKAQVSLLGTFVAESINRKDDGSGISSQNPDDKKEYTPAAFISYKPFEKHALSLRTFYKRIFRMPTFNDLYYTDIGNVALRPEYTNQYNVGMYYSKKIENSWVSLIHLQADAYYIEVEDKIIAVPKGSGQYRWMMMNLGNVEIRGIDLTGKVNLVLPADVKLNMGLNYTYQKAQDFSDPTDNDPEAGTYGGQIAYIPWHSGSFIANVEWKSWNVNYSVIYVGERYHNSSNILENYEQPWYTHDMTFAKSFKMKNIKFRISAEVNNIFDQQYDVVLNYPMPGRNYKVILKLDI